MRQSLKRVLPGDRTGSPSEADKVAFLSLPKSYRERTRNVSVIQTHHAWVFLTDSYAYKMKKPSRYGHYDLSSLEARHHLCAEEVRLNRRLARHTYLGIVGLYSDLAGQLALDPSATIIDWLVKMRRLPTEWLLHNAAMDSRLTAADLDRLMRKLRRFYRRASLCEIGDMGYAERLQYELYDLHTELADPRFEYPEPLLTEVFVRLRRFVDRNAALFSERQERSRIREVHGDLRPEHICMLPAREPEIIDCLEFDENLRRLDCVEELAFLCLECRMIGHPWIEDAIMDWYAHHFRDPAPVSLWRFYAARRAATRAMLCARHTFDTSATEKWLERGRAYLAHASYYLEGAEPAV